MAKESVKKVACVGDSITEGLFLADPQTESYPALLQGMLGAGSEVGNFGASKYAALKTSKFPYWEHEAYQQSLGYNPDIVIIMLGTNDIKTENWMEGKERFVEDYAALIKSYQALETNPQVFVVLPPPIYLDETDEVRPPNNLRGEALPLIAEAAAQTDSYLIDVFSAMDDHPELFYDLIHPNAEGAKVLAQTVYDGLTNPQPAKKAPTWQENLDAIPAFDDPKASMTREEFAMLMTNIFGLEPPEEGEKANFVDTQYSPYKPQIDTAYQMGHHRWGRRDSL